MPSIIIPLLEPHLSRLLSGEKTAEVRRQSPSFAPALDYLYLYHRGAIHGRVRVVAWVPLKGADLWRTVKEWHHEACLSPIEMAKYLTRNDPAAWGTIAADPRYAIRCPGIIYSVRSPQRFASPVPVPFRILGMKYLDADTAALLPACE